MRETNEVKITGVVKRVDLPAIRGGRKLMMVTVECAYDVERDGKKVMRTPWFWCCFEGSHIRFGSTLRDGERVEIKGHLSTHSFIDYNDQQSRRTYIVVETCRRI